MRQVRPSWQKSNWSKLAVGGLFVAFVGSLHAVNLEVFGPSCSIPPPQPPPLRDLNGYFPFQVPDTPDDWYTRAAALRHRLLTVLGLWPMPPRTPLYPVVYGRRDMGDYTVEKVYFESLPGFYVTGNLYRPKGKGKGPFPAVLCPHGHWSNGRFHDAGIEGARRAIAQGAEKFLAAARNPIQARCVHLARMGYVVFNYDMIGYADSIQIPASIAHGFRKQRPEMNDPERWGFFSPQAELWFQNIMGLQTWDSIRALDFLSNLPDVDPTRIAVTGASGGGTQTFILCAVDPRPAVAFPGVMVSTAMQGGCTCENACGLRLDTSNVEIAALFAPKPLGMTAANDWTVQMPIRGFPELQRLYGMLGAPDHVALFYYPQFGHNYNAVSRTAMYRWVQRWLQPGKAVPPERPFSLLTAKDLTVWDKDHPKPPTGPDVERAVCRWLRLTAEEALEKTWQDPEAFFETYRRGWEVVVGRNGRTAGQVEWLPARRESVGKAEIEVGLLRTDPYAEILPAVAVRPNPRQTPIPKGVLVWVTERGKEGILNRDGTALDPQVARAVEAGWVVIAADLYGQGEWKRSGYDFRQARLVPNGREALAYTYGYNPSPFARRVYGVLSLWRWAKDQTLLTGGRVYLVGCHGGGKWVAVAAAVTAGMVDGWIVDTDGFRFMQIRDIRDPDLLPGAAKFGDLPGALAAGIAPRIILAGEGAKLPAILQTAIRLHQPKVRLEQQPDFEGIPENWLQ